MKPLNVKIKELRIEKDWSLREMSAKIPMSHTAYDNIEKGTTQPAWDWILKIAKIHGIPPDELIRSESVTRESLERQTNLDDIYDVLNGINRELALIKSELLYIKNIKQKYQPIHKRVKLP